MEQNQKEMLTQNISFVYNEALELLLAMGMVASQKLMEKLAEDYRIETMPLLDAFLGEANANMSPHSKRELSCFFSNDFLNKGTELGFYPWVYKSLEIQSAEQWLDTFKDIPADEVVAAMVYGVYNDKLDEFLRGREWDAVRGDFETLREDVRLSKPAVEQSDEVQALLLEYLAHPEETKLRYLLLFHQFYRDVFQPWAERIRSASEEAIARYQQLFATDPERFLQDYHKSDPIVYTHPTIFHVSFMAQVGNYRYRFGTPLDWIIFGVLNDRIFGEEAEREKVEMFFKAFSDKRRLEMIALLRERPRYGAELAEQLGITPAAVTYHANFMLFLDVVEIKRSDHRLYYYLKTERLSELLDLSHKVLLGERERL